MDKASMKLVFLVVLLIFVAGETSNIGAEGRVNQAKPCACLVPCYCVGFGNCVCPKDSPLTSQTANGGSANTAYAFSKESKN
ncbi:hypothetical protein LINGRAHAP2_LOCUS33851 [Linum grandiflorum]